MTVEPDQNRSIESPPPRRRRWRWFAGGFLLVFAGMAFTVSIYTWTMRGDGLVRLKLWEYYVFEGRRALTSSRAMGPTSGSSTAAATTALIHLGCSVIGGVVALGVGWVYGRVRKRDGRM